MFGYHTSIWYLLYWPFELVIHVIRFRIRRWLKKNTNLKPEYELSMTGKVVVITGSNSLIGKYAAIEMAKRGAVVVMGCRDLKKGELARTEILNSSDWETVELYRLDLSDLDSVRTFAESVLEKHPVIDILINNAGISVNHMVQQKSKEGWDLCMLTNHLGHYLLTNLLMEGILASDIRRVIAVSSSMLILAKLDPNDLMMENCRELGMWSTKPYSNSKLALSLFTKFLGKRYPGIRTYSVCPSLADTEILRKYERRPVFDTLLAIAMSICLEKVEYAADTLLLCAIGKNMERHSGGFFRFGERLKGIEKVLTDELAEQVWIDSEKVCGLGSVQPES